MQSVAVSNGIFNVLLGASPALTLPFDAPYYLGIAVGSDPEMTPRQPLAAAPYALRAVIAENAALAHDASMLGGFTPSQFVRTTDPRLADARPPTVGSASYIQNTTSPQALSNFNIGGDGLTGGTLGIGAAGPGSKLNVAGMVESTSGGVKFPDGSVLATAKSLAQIATLRWHDTIQTGAAFTVPDNPYGIAFDGASLWVTSRGTNTVIKLRACDGASIGIFATGSDPRGIAFDGSYIWAETLSPNCAPAMVHVSVCVPLPWGAVRSRLRLMASISGSPIMTAAPCKSCSDAGTTCSPGNHLRAKIIEQCIGGRWLCTLPDVYNFMREAPLHLGCTSIYA